MRLPILLPLLTLWIGCLLHGTAQPADSASFPADSLTRIIEAADVEDAPPFRDSLFATPYHTLYHFLYYLQPESWQPAEAAKALAAVGLTAQQAEERAIQLKKVIDGRGIYVYLDELPRTAEHSDSTSAQATYRLSAQLPSVYLQRYGKLWLFSRRTVRETPDLYAALYPFGADRFIKPLAERFPGKTLGLQTWQWMLIGALCVLGWMLYRLQALLLGLLVKSLLPRLRQEHIGSRLIAPISRPVSLLLVLSITQLLLPSLQLPIRTTEALMAALKVLNPLMVVFIAYRLVDFISRIMAQWAARTEGTLDDQLVPLLRRLFKLLVIAVGFLFILSSFEYDVTAVLAGLSLGGLALALAAQDTLKNFFGSIMIFIDRPFQVGHWIIYDKVEGKVEEVGLRSTRVRTFYDSLVYIPNAKLADNVIDNMGLRQYRRMRIEFGVQYDTPPHLIEAFTNGIILLIEAHPSTRKEQYEARFNDLKESSLNILLQVYFDMKTLSEELKARQELLLSILYLARELGVQFAFPTRTLHIENLPGAESLSARYELSADQARDKAAAFAARYRKAWGTEGL